MHLFTVSAFHSRPHTYGRTSKILTVHTIYLSKKKSFDDSRTYAGCRIALHQAQKDTLRAFARSRCAMIPRWRHASYVPRGRHGPWSSGMCVCVRVTEIRMCALAEHWWHRIANTHKQTQAHMRTLIRCVCAWNANALNLNPIHLFVFYFRVRRYLRLHVRVLAKLDTQSRSSLVSCRRIIMPFVVPRSGDADDGSRDGRKGPGETDRWRIDLNGYA